jgi:hypothetical protein
MRLRTSTGVLACWVAFTFLLPPTAQADTSLSELLGVREQIRASIPSRPDRLSDRPRLLQSGDDFNLLENGRCATPNFPRLRRLVRAIVIVGVVVWWLDKN